jgi:hypothetical protein
VLAAVPEDRVDDGRPSFAHRRKWPDVECEAWIPAELPFPERDMNVLRRVEFRWTTRDGEGPPSEAIATLSILRPSFPMEDGSTICGGEYILRRVATSKDFR